MEPIRQPTELTYYPVTNTTASTYGNWGILAVISLPISLVTSPPVMLWIVNNHRIAGLISDRMEAAICCVAPLAGLIVAMSAINRVIRFHKLSALWLTLPAVLISMISCLIGLFFLVSLGPR